MSIASCLQNHCFTSSITSNSPVQRKWEGKAEGGGTCIRKAKACSEVPSRIPRRFHCSLLALREARKAGVLAGYFATLNKIGISESEREGKMRMEWSSSSVCLITETQTGRVIGQVGTSEMAKHNPFISQIRELFISFYFCPVCQKSSCTFQHPGAGLLIPHAWNVSGL